MLPRLPTHHSFSPVQPAVGSGTSSIRMSRWPFCFWLKFTKHFWPAALKSAFKSSLLGILFRYPWMRWCKRGIEVIKEGVQRLALRVSHFAASKCVAVEVASQKRMITTGWGSGLRPMYSYNTHIVWKERERQCTLVLSREKQISAWSLVSVDGTRRRAFFNPPVAFGALRHLQAFQACRPGV